MSTGVEHSLHAHVEELLGQRSELTTPFFRRESPRVAELCQRMADRFARGGRLIAIGQSPAARSDVRHITVEFVHPVIVGKRALPALGFTGDTGSLERQLDLLARADDMVIAFEGDASAHSFSTRNATAMARGRGCLTIAFARVGAEWEFASPVTDGFVWQEFGEVLYHLLWELVHVFFEHGATCAEPATPAAGGAAAASFLYPFLESSQADLSRVLADVQQSIVFKADELTALRAQTIGARGSPNRVALLGAATSLRAAFDAGGTLLTFGNGGSATDATDAAADYRFPPGEWPSRRALDLSDDSAIITALMNDIGADVIFSRQIIAYAQPRDVVMAFSTSGNSRNVIQALAEARARGLKSIAFVGYDGGRIRAERLADHTIVSESQNIPRIQEAQATAHHILRSLVERAR